jgi:hypothetical protein
MVGTNTSDLERFVDALDELEVKRSDLARDASGRTWLPPELLRMSQEDPRCAAALVRFVACEREAFAGAAAAPDVWFCARVMRQVPDAVVLDAKRRQMILAIAYLSAAAVACMAWGQGLEISEWHALYGDLDTHTHASELSNLWIAGTLVAACVGLLLFGGQHVVSRGRWRQIASSETHTPDDGADTRDGKALPMKNGTTGAGRCATA